MNRQALVNIGKTLFLLATALSLAAGFFSGSGQQAWAGDTTRIVVIPFSVNAPKDLSYIKRGINDMLTSRLEKDQAVVVLTADEDETDLKQIAQKSSADYVITGSVTIMGDSVSTDAQVVKAAAPDVPVLSFNRTGSQQADLIEHINELAATINTRILGSGPAQPAPATATAPVAVLPVPTGGQAVTPPAVANAPLPPVSPSQEQPKSLPPPSASAIEPTRLTGIGTIKDQATGIAAGDVDGDGTADIILSTTSHLYVYRYLGGRWGKLAEYDGRGEYIGVDAADVNGNGKQEIFVTQFSQIENKVYSFVMEWDGKTLQRIDDQLPWFFRSVEMVGRGRVLVGQRQSQGERFSSGIYEMKWTGKAYRSGERLTLPKDLNVFGFTYGAARLPDKPEVVRYDSDGHIQFLTPSGEETWVTAERYGGGSNYVVFIDQTQWDVKDYVYLSPRIRLHDIDGDGVQEVLVLKNQNSFMGSSVLDRHRFYAKGRLEWLKWQGEVIDSIAQTTDLARFIADFALVDVNGDGRLDIVAAVVQKPGGITSTGASYLTSFSILSTR